MADRSKLQVPPPKHLIRSFKSNAKAPKSPPGQPPKHLMKSLEKGGFLEQGRNKVILNAKMMGNASQI